MSDICLRHVFAMNPEGEFDGPVDIAVRGGAIERIGRDLPVSDLADLDEFAGLWVMPGLFDCHAHLACFADDTLRYMQMPVTQWTLELAANARRLLEMGVTHVRDPGGADAGIRDGIAQGLVPGPRLQVSISCMSQTGGHADGFLAGPGLEMDSGFLGHNHPGRPPYLADGEDGMRLAVRKVLRAGADWIKLCTTGGLLSTALDHPDEAEFTPEEIAVAVGEAGRKGKPVMAHAYGGEGLTNAVQGGVRSVEHGLNLTERQAAEMADAAVYSIPPPENTDFGHLAVSPNGRTLAFVSTDSANKYLLWVRQLDSPAKRVLHGTEGALLPFSVAGQSLYRILGGRQAQRR